MHTPAFGTCVSLSSVASDRQREEPSRVDAVESSFGSRCRVAKKKSAIDDGLLSSFARIHERSIGDFVDHELQNLHVEEKRKGEYARNLNDAIAAPTSANVKPKPVEPRMDTVKLVCVRFVYVSR